jgi:uncharacterized protein
MNYILSIRGEGIRGIIPACCLVKLEEQLGGLTRDHVQCSARTSTGALPTGAIAAGVPATQILEIYTQQSKEIFTPTGLIGDAKQIAEGYKYDPHNISKVMTTALGDNASWTAPPHPDYCRLDGRP